MPRIWFRADASIRIGTGHVMRCAALAGQLQAQGTELGFVCRDLQGNLIEWLTSKGFKTEVLSCSEDWEEDADGTHAILEREGSIDCLVVDHYGLDARWEGRMTARVMHLMALDDTSDRPHVCHLLLDQNLYDHPEARYTERVPSGCQLLLGPRFALLRPEFLEARRRPRTRNGQVRRLLVGFGGSDPTRETIKALEAIRLLGRPDLAVDVVMGASAPHIAEVVALCERIPNCRIHQQVADMAPLMEGADLSLGAGGTTTWERCAVGLPSLIVAVALNQEAIAIGVHQAGGALYLGPSGQVTPNQIRKMLDGLLSDPSRVRSLGSAAAELVDGRGVERVAKALLSVVLETSR